MRLWRKQTNKLNQSQMLPETLHWCIVTQSLPPTTSLLLKERKISHQFHTLEQDFRELFFSCNIGNKQ